MISCPRHRILCEKLQVFVLISGLCASFSLAKTTATKQILQNITVLLTNHMPFSKSIMFIIEKEIIKSEFSTEFFFLRQRIYYPRFLTCTGDSN
jgi:hypothetical protein